MLLGILPIPEPAELFSPHPNHCAALRSPPARKTSLRQDGRGIVLKPQDA
jgi:hypothetical protein